MSADGAVHYDRGATGDDGAGEDAERAKQGNATDGSSGGRVYGLVCQAFAGGLKTLLQRYHLALIRMPARMQRSLSAALQQQQQPQAQSHTAYMLESQQAKAAQEPSSSCDPASLFASLDRLRQRNISAQKERAPVVVVVATKDDATASDENDAALCNLSSALPVESEGAATQSSQCSLAVQSASKQASPTRIGSTAATAAATANCEADTETATSRGLVSTALDSAPGIANAEHRSGVTAFVAVQPSSASSLSSSSLQSTFGRSRVRSAFSSRIPNFAAAAASANSTGGVVSSSTGDHTGMSADAIHDGAKRLDCIFWLARDTLPVLHSYRRFCFVSTIHYMIAFL